MLSKANMILALMRMFTTFAFLLDFTNVSEAKKLMIGLSVYHVFNDGDRSTGLCLEINIFIRAKILNYSTRVAANFYFEAFVLSCRLLLPLFAVKVILL